MAVAVRPARIAPLLRVSINPVTMKTNAAPVIMTAVRSARRYFSKSKAATANMDIIKGKSCLEYGRHAFVAEQGFGFFNSLAHVQMVFINKHTALKHARSKLTHLMALVKNQLTGIRYLSSLIR